MMKAQSQYSSRWHLWWPFVLLCIVRGSRWMLSGSLPGSTTTLSSAALGCGSAAALYLLILRPPMRDSRGQLLRSALGGVLLITGPLIALLSPHSFSAASLTMALALTPVVIAVAAAATRHTGENLAGRLWPGLATVAGLLLILAQPSLTNPGEDLLLALTPLLTGCGAVLFCSASPTRWRIPASLLGASAVLAIGAGINVATHVPTWPDMAGLAAGFDALQAVLALIALGRLSATRWSAQFAIVPLIVLLEGVVIMPAGIPGRVIFGLLLLAIAGIALLIPPSVEPRFDLGASAVHPSRPD
jgi:drug/metabolite transporter (DMT)-like permease